MKQQFYIGIVENRDTDPLKLGRCKVRIVGIHTPDKNLLPTEDLPWAIQIIPNSASMNGIGVSPTNYVEGSSVLVIFTDEDQQMPVILGSMVGIPQQKSKLIDSTDDELDLSYDDLGTPEIESESVAENPEVVNTSIIIPPVSSGTGLAELEAAIAQTGITSKYFRASILGICLVESNFKTSAENLKYSKERLRVVFPSIFKNDPALAEAVAGKPENTAEVVYGPIKGKGKELGNDVVGDGFKYRGRGFVQLTGKSNYRKYSKVAGVDLVQNPDLLLDNAIAAKVTVQYFLDRTRTSPDDPSYINSAIKAVGHNSPDIYEKKLNAYQKYLGEAASPTLTDKSTDSGESVAQHAQTQKVSGIPVDRASSLNYGFSDPKFKYPLRSYLNEPDTNRLARGRYNNTIVTKKDISSIKNVPVADGTTWSQPQSPYNAKYPYNHVLETESGHVQEFDDTPGNERIHTYHRKGTFQEIDCNGSKVTRVVGDSYEILDRNGNIYISGNANITAAGNINIFTQSNANIKVNGNADIKVHGNTDMNVAGNYTTNVGGAYKVKASSISFESSTHDIKSNSFKNTADNMDIKSDEYNETVTGESSYRWEGDKHYFIGADQYERHDAGRDHSCPIDPPRDSGVSCSDVNEASDSSSTGLGSSISSLKPLNVKFGALSVPIRDVEKVFIFESPEELNGSQPDIPDEKPEMQSNKIDEPIKSNIESIPATCDMFKNMEDFSPSLVLHTDSTGYEWTLGKLLNGNKLKSVTVKGINYSKSDIVCNLKTLAENVLSRLNETIGPVDRSWSITSCYRSYIPPGGSATSQHLIGMAVDISVGGNVAYNTTYDWAKKLSSTLIYDQFLLEYLDRNGTRINWIHISYSSKGNRGQVLTFLNHKTNNQNLKKLA